MRKRLLLSLLMVILVVLCIGSAALGEKISIRGMRWLSWPEERELVDKWIKEYQAAHPDVKVDIEWITTGYGEKLLTSFAAGLSPDMFFVHTPGLPLYAEEEMMLPLDKYIEGPNGIDAKDIYDSIWKVATYKGKRYGFSCINGIQVLYYNKTMFDKAGLAYPDDKLTWGDLAAYARKLTLDIDKDGRIDQYGFQCDEYNRVWMSYLWSIGGKAFDNEESPREVLFNRLEGVEAAKYVTELTLVHGVSPPPGVPGALGYREAFRTEKVAMILDGSWMINSFSRQKGLNYGVSYVPKGKTRACWYDVCIWAISSQSKYPDQTWDFVKFISGPDKALTLADFGGTMLMGIPSWKSALRDPRWKPSDLVRPAAEQMAIARAELAFHNAGRWFWEMLNPKLQEIIITKKDPKVALDELAEQTVKEILEKMPK